MLRRRRLANEAQIKDKSVQKGGVHFAYELPGIARSGTAEASVSRLQFVGPAVPCCLVCACQAGLHVHLKLAEGPYGQQSICGVRHVKHLRPQARSFLLTRILRREWTIAALSRGRRNAYRLPEWSRSGFSY